MIKSRQLAAIMFTDVVGYTKMMNENEQRALDLLEKNQSIQRPIIEKLGGRWIKEIGDGVLASFSTASDAVYCAKEIQEASKKESHLKLRIGIHIGEVVFQDDDVLGDGVNIASRIETLAPVGGIFISEAVFRNIQNKQGIDAVFVMEKLLKNVSHPIRIYSVIHEGSIDNLHSIRLGSKNKGWEKSIAVLPFVNMSSDQEQEYFSDGLTEEVITDLSQLDNLMVISRSSAMAFKGSAKNLKEIASDLNVRYILEGGVRKAGNKLRITAQLIDAETDTHLWAEKYTGSVDDIFQIQENVSKSILNSLSLRFDESAFERSKRPVRNIRAYELYRKAQYEIFQFKEDGLKRAFKYLDDALEIEGENPFLYAKMGAALLSLMNVLNKVDHTIFFRVRRLTEQIFRLAPDSPLGHSLLGYLSFYEGNIKDAVIQLQTAYNSDPDNDNLWLLILGYSYLGQSDQAEEYAVLLGEVDPYNPVCHALKSVMYYLKGDLEMATSEIITAYEMYPEVPQVQLYYAYHTMINGESPRAIELLDRYIVNTSGSIFSVIGKLFKAAIENSEVDMELTKEEEEKLKIDVEWSWLIADFYAMIKQNTKALYWLEHAVNRGFINYHLLMHYDPFLENLRGDCEFLNLMARAERLHQDLQLSM
ncbi:MAG: FlgO family outer membrane protein [Saprospiraceae bacterium]|nr:FlgO family outer membrane protein [Saprospiraceae bacterium]